MINGVTLNNKRNFIHRYKVTRPIQDEWAQRYFEEGVDVF